MVILLTGPDLYRSHQRLTQLRQAFIEKYDPSGFNTLTVDATTATPEELRTAVTTTGLFTAKRFVAIDYYSGTGTLTPDGLNQALTPLATVDDMIVIVRSVKTSSRAPRRTTKTKKVSSKAPAELKIAKAKVEEFSALSRTEIQRWITAEAKSRGGAIESSAAEQLAVLCQNDTWRISSELDKLIAYAGQRVVIADDVQTMVYSPYESNIFAVTDALGQGQRGRALRVLHDELLAGTHPLVLVATIANHLRTLLMIQAIAGAQTTAASVAQQTGIHPYVVQKSLGQVKHFSRERLVSWHHQLVTIDDQLKSGPLDAETLLDLLLVGQA